MKSINPLCCVVDENCKAYVDCCVIIKTKRSNKDGQGNQTTCKDTKTQTIYEMSSLHQSDVMGVAMSDKIQYIST